jgi:hypothetical protein
MTEEITEEQKQENLRRYILWGVPSIIALLIWISFLKQPIQKQDEALQWLSSYYRELGPPGGDFAKLEQSGYTFFLTFYRSRSLASKESLKNRTWCPPVEFWNLLDESKHSRVNGGYKVKVTILDKYMQPEGAAFPCTKPKK